jgi:hypothetical protein
MLWSSISEGVASILRLFLAAAQGVVYAGREDLTPDNYLSEVAVDTHKRTLQEAIEGADVFLGLSVSHDSPAVVVLYCPTSLPCLDNAGLYSHAGCLHSRGSEFET